MLTRELDQSVMVGDQVRVTIIEVRGGKVRLGFDAPTEIAIHRQEVYDHILRRDGQVSPGGNLDARHFPPVISTRTAVPRGPLATANRGAANGQPGRGGSYTGRVSGRVGGAGDTRDTRDGRADRGPHGYPIGMGGREGGGK